MKSLARNHKPALLSRQIKADCMSQLGWRHGKPSFDRFKLTLILWQSLKRVSLLLCRGSLRFGLAKIEFLRFSRLRPNTKGVLNRLENFTV